MIKMNKNTEHRGFTLIELMIVVAIIGILAAVAVPKFAEMIRKSKEGATKGSLAALRSSMTIYVSDNEGVQPLSRFVTVAAQQLDDQLRIVLVPKYQEAVPQVKLGTYHTDSNAFHVRRTTGVWDSNRSSDTAIVGNGGEAGGWIYTSASEGIFWVNCGHTDTKYETITGW